MNKMPNPVIMTRLLNKELYENAIKSGATPLQAHIIANRNIPDGTDINNFMNPSLDNIPNIGNIKDIQKAGSRIADAIITGEQICLACDFDVDGISSAAVLYKALSDLFNVPNYKIDVCISNRMTEGYGFSDKVVDRILAKDPIPTLIITADQGSANGAQVTRFIEETKKLSVKRGKKRILTVGDVIISDHHEIPVNGGPEDAYAFVNPQRPDDTFPDKTICGCTVAMFLMAATRAALIKKGHLTNDAPTIKPLMAYSTAATISDCVSMASGINRAIVRKGLDEINNETIPAWKAMKKLTTREDNEPVRAESIAFGLGPMINACSRTGGDGMNAVRYYLSETDYDAERYLSFLNVDNDLRKDIEKRLVEESIQKAGELIDKGYHSLVIPIKNGHHGIHGIAASRLVERFGRPTIILSPKETSTEIITRLEAERLLGYKLNMSKLEDFYDIPKSLDFITYEIQGTGKSKKTVFFKKTITAMSGSGRSIDGLNDDHKGQLNLLKCMIEANDSDPENPVFIGFGGHHMAAGMGLLTKNIIPLRNKIEESVKKYVAEDQLFPKVWSDGRVPEGYVINDDFIDEMSELEPFGRQFDYPAFTIEAEVSWMLDEPCGKNKDTGRFKLIYDNKEFSAIWFKMVMNPFFKEVQSNKRYKFVVEPRFNYFRGSRTVQFNIKHVEHI